MMPVALRQLLPLAASCVWLAGLAQAYVQPQRFVIISSPKTRNVYYAALPSLHDLTLPWQQRKAVEAQVLIDGGASRCSGSWCYEDSDRGLQAPSGIALKQGCGSAVLFVSDTAAQDLFAYEITVSALGGLQAGPQRRLRQGIAGEAEWLAVDGLGNLFMTSVSNNQVQVIPTDRLFSSTNLSEPASVLYSADATPTVKAPAGVATDGFFVYWANQNGDGSAGTISRGPQSAHAAQQPPQQSQQPQQPQQQPPQQAQQPQQQQTSMPIAVGSGAYEAMASNICLARDNAFFTGTTGSVFGAKKCGGSNMTEVAAGLTKPLGCAYDGESTLYVADGGDNAIYSLPANLVHLRAIRHLSKVVTVDGPSQLAVFSSSTSRHCPHQPMPSNAPATSGRAAHFAAAVATVAAMATAVGGAA